MNKSITIGILGLSALLSVAVQAQTISFGARTDIAAGDSPRGLTKGDFNRDGKLDLAVVHAISNDLYVLLGDGTGKFPTRNIYPSSTRFTAAVVAADFNNDGILDVAITGRDGNPAGGTNYLLSVRFGNGDGTFGSETTYPGVESSYSIASADFNGDGRLDLVYGNGSVSNSSLFVRLNNGNGTFGGVTAYTSGGTAVYGVAVSDFNVDGNADIVAISGDANNVSVFLGNGTGNFPTRADYAVGATPRTPRVSDFNGDGKPDIIVTNFSDKTLSVLLNKGDGTFSTKTDYPTSAGNFEAIGVDLNGDGKPDIAAADNNGNLLSVRPNNGDGTFGARIDFAAGQTTRAIVSGDFNGDGKQDVAVAQYGTDSVGVFLNTTTISNSAPTVVTNAATNVTSTSATLNATISAGGATTSPKFQYGTTTSYGTNVTLADITGTTGQNVSANLTGLTPGTTYHFRASATNSVGTTNGADVTFTTLEAPSLVVTTTSDNSTNTDGVTSLREAINFANSNADASTVTFSPTVFASKQKITFNGARITITQPLVLTGPAAGVTIDTSTGDSEFQVNASTQASNLTMQNGYAAFEIYAGNSNFTNCTFIGYSSALDIRASGATVAISRSTFNQNNVAIFILGSSSGVNLNIESSTIAGNSNGIWDQSTTVITTSNSIIAGNNANLFGNATITDNGFNLLSGDPKLGPLQDNGGPTLTMLPLRGSATIDKGKTANGALDQRGLARRFDDPNIAPASGGDNSDIGAVEVQNVTNVPPVVSVFSVNATEDTTLTFAVNSFDGAFSDSDAGDTLQSIRIASLPSNGTLNYDGNAVTLNQTIARADLTQLTFAPTANFNGSTSFNYNASDGLLFAANNATVTLNVAAVNDAPTISAIATQTTNEDTATNAIGFTIGDIETAPASLIVSATSSNTALVPNANIVIGGSGANRTLTITPSANASGSANITVTVSDGNLTASRTFALTVNAVNDAPTIGAIGAQTTNEDTATGAISVIVGDIETAPAALTVTAVSDNQSVVTNAGIIVGGSGTDRTLTITPAADAFGVANITVTVSDGALTSQTSFTLTVNAVNDTPSFTLGATQTVDEDAGSQSVSGFATNINKGAANESTQTLSFDVSNNNNALFSAQPAISADGTLNFTPADNANGSATISVQVQDSGGTLNGGVDTSATQTFTLTVSAVNDAPIALADAYSTNEDNALIVSATAGILANDSDIDGDSLSAVLVSGPSNGTLALNADGSFTYTPNANYNGSDSFSYKANDGALESAVTTVTLTVTAVSDAPVAGAQSVTTNEDTAKAITLSASDVDSSDLTYRVVDAPTHGTLSGTAPNLTYTPNADYNGADSFTFVANDGALDSANATVAIAVNAVNDAPVAVADAYAIDQNTTLTVNATNGVLKNDSDVDNSALSAILDTGVAHGTLTLNADGSFTYVPTVGYRGNDSFSYHVNDGTLKSAIVTVNLTVTATPQPINFGVSLTPKAPATNSVVTATPIIVDATGVSFSYAWSVNGVVKQTGPSNSLDLNVAGNGDKGDKVSVVVTATRDIDGGTATNFVNVFNSAPFAFSQSGAAKASVPTQFTLRGADLDAETLTYKSVGGPGNGSATIINNADGSATLTYTGRADFNGVETIRFVSIDESGRPSTPATLAINVTRVTPAPAPNRAPFANNVTASTKSGVEVKIALNGTDPDGDALTFKRVGGPSNGSGDIRRDVDGVFKMFYTPRANFVGNEVIQFVALDTAGKPSPVATMTINVRSSSSALQSAPSSGNS